MARSGSSNHLWKETPATSMTKAQLLGLANAKDMKLKELRRKYKARKAISNELRAALAAARVAQATETTTPALIPKPRGTSGRGSFNLANEMGVETTVYYEIQSFVRSLVNLSAVDKTQHWKNQPGDEIHKIFTVAAEKYPVMAKFEYNWATAEMVKLYLRNSRAQEKRKSRAASTSNINPAANPRQIGANAVTEANTRLIGAASDSEDSEDDDSDED